MKISDIPFNLRPREKALQFGIEELTDQELLSLIIGSGVRGNSAIEIAQDLLNSHGNSIQNLAKTNYQSLISYLGLKKSIALRILAAFELHRRLISNKYQNVTTIESINDVYFRYKYLENYEQEVLMILMLDLKKRIIKEKILYKGTFDSFTVDVREIIQELVLAKAKYYYLLHNHPDEETNPSEEDILSTKVIEISSKNLGIILIDHLVIYKGGFSCVKGR